MFLLRFLQKISGNCGYWAKGAKKINAKLAPHLDTLNRSEIAFVKGKRTTRLTGAITADYWREVKSDYNRLMAGFFAAELVDQLMEENAVSQKEYDEAVSFFYKLNSIANRKTQFMPYIFTARFLSLLGYHPHLEIINNETKLFKIGLHYGYDFLNKLDLSGVNLKKMRIITEKMLFEVARKELSFWKFI